MNFCDWQLFIYADNFYFKQNIWDHFEDGSKKVQLNSCLNADFLQVKCLSKFNALLLIGCFYVELLFIDYWILIGMKVNPSSFVLFHCSPMLLFAQKDVPKEFMKRFEELHNVLQIKRLHKRTWVVDLCKLPSMKTWIFDHMAKEQFKIWLLHK